MSTPQQYRFAKSHEWIAPDGRVGISDHAQKEITDVVFVDLPKEGRQVKAGESVAVVESVKAAFDIYAPVSGKIAKINTEITKNPGVVNQSAFENGWLFTIEKQNADEEKGLMDFNQYQKFIQTNGH